MFRPERMTSVSIICLRKDVDKALAGLEDFGEFHVEDVTKKPGSAAYNGEIQQTREKLANIEQLIEQFSIEKRSILQSVRYEKIERIEITAENWQSLADNTFEEISKIKNETDALNLSLSNLQNEAADLQYKKDSLKVMKTLGVDLEATEKLSMIHIALATAEKAHLPDLRKALQTYPIILHNCYLSKGKQFLCTAFPSKYKSEIERILRLHQAELFKVPEGVPPNLNQALKKIDVQLQRNSKKRRSILGELNRLAASNKNRLLSLREVTQSLLITLKAKQKILQSSKISRIEGFIPAKRIIELRKKIRNTLNEAALVLENYVEPFSDPPTRIRNSRFVKPFEEITRLYGLPHYDEIDPTPIIAISFPIIFGFMFGDVGHGLFLLIGGLILGKLVKNNNGIRNFCWIFAACGFGAIIAGILFGEFFGIQIFAPLWLDPFDNVLSFLIFSLFVGVIQIESGLIIDLVNFALRRNFVDALLTSGSKIAFYAASVYLIFVYQLDFASWFRGPILLVLVPFFILVFGKRIYVKLARPFWGSMEVPQETSSLLERFFEGSDLVSRLLSNTVSYTRILALLMAHYALILATYVVAGLMASSSFLGLILGGVVVVVGNLFVIGLEGLIVFIHSLRLHFYEWFSKFYQGTGTPFEPFKREFVHTELILEK